MNLPTPDQTSSVFPLAVEIQGQGHPILCLHGHPGSAQCMSVFTKHLGDRFQTITPDLRGYGKSQTRQPFVMEDHLTDLIALIDRLQIDQLMILGWSLGGILAIELALKQPDRVSGLILVATAARPRGDHPPITWQDNLYTGIAALINKIKPGWQWNIDTFGKRSLFRYLIQQHTDIAYQHLANEAMPAYLQTTPAATQALWTAQAQRIRYDRLADLTSIECPVLMLTGLDDRHITASASQETAEHLRNCESHCYRDTAHLFPWEISEQVLADIDSWLQRHPAKQ
ncbi:MAG: alpha/beta hydrolase [Leptolyngbyaceae cyanobacterium CRU_2_3]|nr:alpha/beta hydrolase [Leptolyngbyaceae cyanobacterium CRU_2_3]